MQLDRVVIPQSLFAPARCYSLVQENGGFYLIYTGKVLGRSSEVSVGAAIANAILDKRAEKEALRTSALEEQLRQQSPQALKDTKHSRYVPKASIKEVIFKKGALYSAYPVVVVKAEKKLKLHFPQHDSATVRDFFAPFSATAAQTPPAQMAHA